MVTGHKLMFTMFVVFRHDCGIFVIKYAEYMLHNDMKSLPTTFDASRARLDIATLLFKHKETKKPSKLVKPKGESIDV